MATKAFHECLLDVYHGEMAGEAAFEGMLARAEDAQQRYIVGSLLQFETEGKAKLRPLLMRYDLSMRDDAESMSGAAAAAGQLNALLWVERFSALGDLVRRSYLPRYQELATLVSADEDPEAARIAAFMGAHERALVALSDNIVAGAPDPAAPVSALLSFPLPRPAR